MHKLETHFIPENVAPAGTKRIAVLRQKGADTPAEEVGYVPLGALEAGVSPSSRRFRFLALADIHLTYDTAEADFVRALDFAQDPQNECDFVCIAGDLTSTGTYGEMSLFKRLVTEGTDKPVYAITGNHEHYDTLCADYLEACTGFPLYYSFERGNDVFVMLGHWGSYRGDGIGWRSNEFISAEELQWLYETLEENRNRRCFVFCHVLPHEHGVGNPNGLYTTALIWNTADGNVGQALADLLRHYRNVLFFHGHSHTRFDLQAQDPKANYGYVTFSDGSGYRSIHIPSLSAPRDLKEDGSGLKAVFAESEGYIVDVYDHCILLNGQDFGEYDAETDTYKKPHRIPIATYKIDTPLHTVEAGTFADSTGLIRT